MFKYIPDNLQGGRPLVVALHGCKQRASAYDNETGWTRFADKLGFTLLLPEQKSENNSFHVLTGFIKPHRSGRRRGTVDQANDR
jgi:poly(hydroxyalkanoate) depolymerase family esterase